jgi:hypothetical protein
LEKIALGHRNDFPVLSGIRWIVLLDKSWPFAVCLTLLCTDVKTISVDYLYYRGFQITGTNVMIFKIFSLKNWRKFFFLKLLLIFPKNLIITLVFEENAKFFAEN